MTKYGYRTGQGLGRNNQGISNPLQVLKITDNQCVIVQLPKSPISERNSPETQSQSIPKPPSPRQNVVSENVSGVTTTTKIEKYSLENPSKVVLLKNMVDEKDVDDELNAEIHDECDRKYGRVKNVTIVPVNVKVDENVDKNVEIRVFVEFEQYPSAVKALIDLNSRFFAGRKVVAQFYNFNNYKNAEFGN